MLNIVNGKGEDAREGEERGGGGREGKRNEEAKNRLTFFKLLPKILVTSPTGHVIEMNKHRIVN